MKAAQITQYGGPEVIHIADAPEPTIQKNTILVEVYAASLNPFDTTVRNGTIAETSPLPFPAIQGGDFAGVVKEVGEGVTDVTVGDAVYGQASLFRGGTGSMAEFAVTPQNQFAKKPTSVNFVEAAALPLVSVSALQALTEHMNLQQGQRILIHGGAGGIGSIAIQLAKHIGAYIITTAATDEIEFVKELGADEVIDYTTERFEDKVSNVDAVYDTVAGETYTRSFSVLKKGGIIVSMLEQPNQELMDKYGVTAIAQQTVITPEKLTKLAQLVDEGAIKPQVDRVFPLEETAAAFAYRENEHPRGKVVVEIKKGRSRTAFFSAIMDT